MKPHNLAAVVIMVLEAAAIVAQPTAANGNIHPHDEALTFTAGKIYPKDSSSYPFYEALRTYCMDVRTPGKEHTEVAFRRLNDTWRNLTGYPISPVDVEKKSTNGIKFHTMGLHADFSCD